MYDVGCKNSPVLTDVVYEKMCEREMIYKTEHFHI